MAEVSIHELNAKGREVDAAQRVASAQLDTAQRNNNFGTMSNSPVPQSTKATVGEYMRMHADHTLQGLQANGFSEGAVNQARNALDGHIDAKERLLDSQPLGNFSRDSSLNSFNMGKELSTVAHTTATAHTVATTATENAPEIKSTAAHAEFDGDKSIIIKHDDTHIRITAGERGTDVSGRIKGEVVQESAFAGDEHDAFVNKILGKLPPQAQEALEKAGRIVDDLPAPLKHIAHKAEAIAKVGMGVATVAGAAFTGEAGAAIREIETLTANTINAGVGIVDVTGATGDKVGETIVATAKRDGLVAGLKAGATAAGEGLNATRVAAEGFQHKINSTVKDALAPAPKNTANLSTDDMPPIAKTKLTKSEPHSMATLINKKGFPQLECTAASPIPASNPTQIAATSPSPARGAERFA